MNSKRMKNSRLFGTLAGLLIAAAMTVGAAAQAIEGDWFVDDATGSDTANSGTLWSAPFETLQKALDEADAAQGPQIIFVAAGTYHPDEGPTQTPGDAGATYDMIADVAVYGGFLNGDDFGDRDPMANETILSGDIPAPGNNSNNVVSFSVLSGNPAILDGFTVRDGSSNGFGGGIIVQNTQDARIRNCIIRDNYATTGGGVGAVFNSLGHVLEIRNCRFVTNGAVFGGGIALKFSDDAEINVINCEFSLNDAAFGGGLYASGGKVTVVNATFTENTAVAPNDGDGGGAYFTTGAEALVINSLFLFNTCNDEGGAVYVTGSATTAELNNCTLSKNHADDRGGGIVGNNSTDITITNGILYGNTDDAVGTDLEESQLLMLSGMVTVTYTCIEGLVPGGQFDSGDNVFNIPDDPDFVEEDGSDPDEFDSEDNFRLYYESPCIDAADNDAVDPDVHDVDEDSNDTEDTPDLDFNDRRIDDPESSDTGNGDPPIVDMGAYEFEPCPADLDGSCAVGVKDLLILLGAWGPCPDPPAGCPADFDFDDAVGVKDLLFLLGNWGPCPCAPHAVVLSLDDKLAEACVTPENWDAFEAKMKDANASQEEKDNYYCWMDHHLFDCTCLTCWGALCPGPDPYIP